MKREYTEQLYGNDTDNFEAGLAKHRKNKIAIVSWIDRIIK